MTTAVTPEVREQVLRYASRVTSDAADPSAVVINAVPLLAWLEDAADERDQDLRVLALQRHNSNLMASRIRDESADDVDAFLCSQRLAPAKTDNPETFLREAKVYYAFMTAGDA